MASAVSWAWRCAALVTLALLAIPFWLLAGVPHRLGLALLGGFAALAGVGLGLAVRAHLASRSGGAALAGLVNGGLLVLATWILWAWGTYLAEPPCPDC